MNMELIKLLNMQKDKHTNFLTSLPQDALSTSEECKRKFGGEQRKGVHQTSHTNQQQLRGNYLFFDAYILTDLLFN